MKTFRKVALFALISCSVLSVSSTFCMKNDKDYSTLTERGYKAIANWFATQDWVTKAKMYNAIKKLKDIEWSKVKEYVYPSK